MKVLPMERKREPFVVGLIRDGEEVMARKCAWCKAWTTESDRRNRIAGARVTHGICEQCKADLFPDDAA